MFVGYLRLRAQIFVIVYSNIRNIVLQYTISILNFYQFYCFMGDPGSLTTSEMEFFARIFSICKLLYISCCLKEPHLRCSMVSESGYVNQITLAAFFLY